MSLQWSETLMHIGLGTLYGNELRVLVQPNSIELSLLKRDFLDGFKSRIVKRLRLESTETATAQALPSELMQQLTSALEDRDWHVAAPVVVLSSAFVRYGILSWNAEIKSKPERKAYLQYTFLHTFGDVSKAWHLRAHDAGYGKAALASGVERSLLEQLQAVFKAVNMPLKAAHPLLMLATNQALLQLKKTKLAPHFWLVCHESERLTLALVENGDWKHVWNMAAELDIGAQMHAIMQREVLLNQVSDTLPILHYDLEDLMQKKIAVIKRNMKPQAADAKGTEASRKLAQVR